MAGSLGVLPGGVSGPPAEGFEDVAPVRAFTSYKGQRHLPGLWWSSTMGGHIGYESWLERDHVKTDTARERRQAHAGSGTQF